MLDLLRARTPLDAKAKAIHDEGLDTLLKQLHDDLDTALLEAYGWTDLIAPVPLADRLHPTHPDSESLEQTLLTRLVALNHERAAEEKRGLIRWLRPDFQAPVQVPTQTDFDMGEAPKKVARPKTAKQAWPRSLPDQVQAIRATLTASAAPTAAAEIARTYTGARADRIEEVLAALVALGQARRVGARYAA